MTLRESTPRPWKFRSRCVRWVFLISALAGASSTALFGLSSILWFKIDIEQGDEHGWNIVLTDGCIVAGRYQVTWCLESGSPDESIEVPAISGFAHEFETQWPPSIVWWPDFARRRRFIVPLWTPSALCALPAFLTRPRRLKLGQCTTCGYTLAGLIAQACPECGTPTTR